jgi:anti-sigma B factor antagonist
MAMKSRLSGDIQILELEGRLDAHQAPQLSSWLSENIHAGAGNLIISLEKVNFIDSIALAVLVKAIMRCRESDGKLHLCSLSSPVRIILELTQLHKVFDIFATEAEAVAAFE